MKICLCVGYLPANALVYRVSEGKTMKQRGEADSAGKGIISSSLFYSTVGAVMVEELTVGSNIWAATGLK